MNRKMKWLRDIILLLVLFLFVACGSDDLMDQNTNDPDNTPPQTENPGNNQDSDNDGVNDAEDECPDTPANDEVDDNGCSASQLDSDNDGVIDTDDECPDTPENEEVDDAGCSDVQKDSDGDGVNDALDQCPETPQGEEVNEEGCSDSERKTYIPDDGFEQNLIDLGVDDVLDDYVLTVNIESITELEIHGSPNAETEVKDLTGLQDFLQLERLTLKLCFLDNFEILSETSLKELSLEDFSSVESNFIIDKHPTLKKIWIYGYAEGPLEIKNNPELEIIDYPFGTSNDLSIQNNPKLNYFGATEGSFKTLKIQDNSQLEVINLGVYVAPSWVDYLEVINNQKLAELYLAGDIDNVSVSDCPSITKIMISGVHYYGSDVIPITSLDPDGTPELETLYMENVSLPGLDLSYNTKLLNFELKDHNIQCIKVNQQQLDNIPTSWSTDPEVTYSLDCN